MFFDAIFLKHITSLTSFVILKMIVHHKSYKVSK